MPETVHLLQWRTKILKCAHCLSSAYIVDCAPLYTYIPKIIPKYNKNIPCPAKDEYEIQLISKNESFIKRMKCWALEFPGKQNSSTKETYGFESKKCHPVVKELFIFKDGLIKKLNIGKVKLLLPCISGSYIEIKIKLNFYFHTSFWCL